jgi:hypothetical protein
VSQRLVLAEQAAKWRLNVALNPDAIRRALRSRANAGQLLR